MKNKTEEYFKGLGMDDKSMNRIKGWFKKIDEDVFVEKYKEMYKACGDVDKARRKTWYQFAETNTGGTSKLHELIVVGTSGAFITKHGKNNLSEDEIVELKPGEVPDHLLNLQDSESGTPQPIWSRSYSVVAKDNNEDFTVFARVLQYNENVMHDLPEKAKIVVNLNKRVSNDGDVSFNWASDSKDTLKILEEDINVSDYVTKHRAILLGTSGKFSNRDTKKIELMVDGKRGVIWQDKNYLNVELPPALTEVEFVALGSQSAVFNNASEFDIIDYIDPTKQLNGIEVFDFYGDMVNWWQKLDDKLKAEITIRNKPVQQAEDSDPTGRIRIPIYIVIRGGVVSLNLKPHERTGNGWIQISLESDDPNQKPISCFVPPEAVAEGVAVGEETYGMIQLQHNVEDDGFTGNMIGIRCVDIKERDHEKPKEVKMGEKKAEEIPKKEEKKEEKTEKPKKEPVKETKEGNDDVDLDKEFSDF